MLDEPEIVAVESSMQLKLAQHDKSHDSTTPSFEALFLTKDWFSPRISPRDTAEAMARLREEEDARRYRIAIASSLDTALPATPKESKRRKPRPEMPKPAAADAPSASKCLAEGTRLAEVGMDFQASRKFIEGLARQPHSPRLEAAFARTLERGKCTCRAHQKWAKPCPPARPLMWQLGEESDQRIRGVTWSVCGGCGAIWPDKPHKMTRGARKKEGKTVVDEEEDDDEEEEDCRPQKTQEVLDMLSSFTFDDLLPRDPRPKRNLARSTKSKAAATSEQTEAEQAANEAPSPPKDGNGLRAAEREKVEDAISDYFTQVKAIHAHYSNQSGNDAEQCLGASAFTIDKSELKIFLQDCGLSPGANAMFPGERGEDNMSRGDLDLIFMRVNMENSEDKMVEEAGSSPFGSVSSLAMMGAGLDASAAKINNFDDSATELTAAEFMHLLIRVSQARLPKKRRGKNVAEAFIEMMEDKVLPNAHKDNLAFLRDSFETDKRLRHVVFMHRKKLTTLFRKNCGPLKGDRTDKTSRDHMSLRAFTQVVSESGLQSKLDMQLREVTLVFLQSQNESYEQFSERTGTIDTEMNYSEFLEALLRISVQAAGGASEMGSSIALREAILPTMKQLVGELEGAERKLDWARLTELVREEERRIQELKTADMLEEFWELPQTNSKNGKPMPKDQKILWNMGEEAIFRRMLDALEREGDVEAGKQRGPPKKPVALLRAGAKVRLGVKLGPSLKLGALGRL